MNENLVMNSGTIFCFSLMVEGVPTNTQMFKSLKAVNVKFLGYNCVYLRLTHHFSLIVSPNSFRGPITFCLSQLSQKKDVQRSLGVQYYFLYPLINYDQVYF